ncbi:MAG: uridine kinase [Candidatus Zixiibacteriota bacterium]
MVSAACPQFIGIAGPSGAGKTVLAEMLQHRLGEDATEVIPLDAYYHSHHDLSAAQRANLNFDSPDAFDWSLLTRHLKLLRNGQSVERPVYDYTTHLRASATVTAKPARFIIIEGVLALHDADLRELMNLRIYVDCDDVVCLRRRVERDTRERGRSYESVIHQYGQTVRPMYEQCVLPTRSYADLIVRGDGDLALSVEMVMQAIAGKGATPSSE